MVQHRRACCNCFLRLAFAVSFSVPCVGATGEETVENSDIGFTLTLPDGFEADASLASAAPHILAAFRCGNPADDEFGMLLFIEKMRGTIRQESLTPKDLPSGFQGRWFKMQWQGWDVDAFAVPEQLGDVSVLTFNVQIPLKKVAIQVKLFGRAEHETEMRAKLAEILSGLHGESNWNSSGIALPKVRSSENYSYILLGFAIIFIVGGLVVLMAISRFTPQGTVLAIAAAIYMSSFVTDSVKVREIVLLTGAMRMLGFAGGILGIIDLLRKRKPRENSQSP